MAPTAASTCCMRPSSDATNASAVAGRVGRVARRARVTLWYWSCAWAGWLAGWLQVTFAFNSGPLAWSILAFRNSLVFHDIDKVGLIVY